MPPRPSTVERKRKIDPVLLAASSNECTTTSFLHFLVSYGNDDAEDFVAD
jgi:hypothetical protein